MIEPSFEEFDLDSIRRAALHWEVDPDYFPWLQATFAGVTVHMRWNPEFPATPLYSLLVREGAVFDFEELPRSWTRTNDLNWPESAARDVDW